MSHTSQVMTGQHPYRCVQEVSSSMHCCIYVASLRVWSGLLHSLPEVVHTSQSVTVAHKAILPPNLMNIHNNGGCSYMNRSLRSPPGKFSVERPALKSKRLK